jgi:hypothetical protein
MLQKGYERVDNNPDAYSENARQANNAGQQTLARLQKSQRDERRRRNQQQGGAAVAMVSLCSLCMLPGLKRECEDPVRYLRARQLAFVVIAPALVALAFALYPFVSCYPISVCLASNVNGGASLPLIRTLNLGSLMMFVVYVGIMMGTLAVINGLIFPQLINFVCYDLCTSPSPPADNTREGKDGGLDEGFISRNNRRSSAPRTNAIERNAEDGGVVLPLFDEATGRPLNEAARK